MNLSILLALEWPLLMLWEQDGKGIFKLSTCTISKHPGEGKFSLPRGANKHIPIVNIGTGSWRNQFLKNVLRHLWSSVNHLKTLPFLNPICVYELRERCCLAIWVCRLFSPKAEVWKTDLEKVAIPFGWFSNFLSICGMLLSANFQKQPWQ